MSSGDDTPDSAVPGSESWRAIYVSGLDLWDAGDLGAARDHLDRAARLAPWHREIAYNLGVLLRDLGRLGDAVAVWQDLVTRDPGQADAWLNLGTATEEIAGMEAARAVYQRALLALPDDPPLLYNSADLRYRMGDIEGALALYQSLLRMDPGRAAAWLNAGMALKRTGQWDLAEQFYRQAIALDDPTCLARAWFNLGHLLLARGRWAEGWAAYEWRREIPNAPRPDWGLPLWTADAPNGTRVLLWSDQGFGDTIQYLRYVPRLAALGHHVLIYTNDRLVGLCAGAPGVAEAHGLSGPPPTAHRHLPIGSLPHVTAGSAPFWPGPYVATPPPLALPTRDRRLKVGLVWAGNPDHVNDAERSRSLAECAPLFDVPGIDWFSLQTGRPATALPGSPWAGRLIDLEPRLTDFTATAAALAALDLLIAVDTASIHLAGAMGHPAWLLLPPIETDWRWGLSGETTAWYPSLRLFRSEGPGGVAGAVRRMVESLSALVAAT